MSGDKLTLDLLLARMKCRLADWDEEEPRADWWAYQREYADAYAALSGTTELIEALQNLATAESEYRKLHDLHGDDDMRTGRAWDWMRRKGDAARKALNLHDRALGK